MQKASISKSKKQECRFLGNQLTQDGCFNRVYILVVKHLSEYKQAKHNIDKPRCAGASNLCRFFPGQSIELTRADVMIFLTLFGIPQIMHGKWVWENGRHCLAYVYGHIFENGLKIDHTRIWVGISGGGGPQNREKN